LKFRDIRGQKCCALGCFPVGAQKCRGCRSLPELGPRFEAGYISGVALGVVDEAGLGGIAERAQHTSHIFERTLFGTAIGERPRRFTFKIEDHEIGLHAQHLA
jgi:hypothetical protein